MRHWPRHAPIQANIVSLHRHRLNLDVARLDTLDDGIGVFAEEVDPLLLETGVMLGCFDEIHETVGCVFESRLQRLIRNSSARVERFVRLREREHVAIDTCAQVLVRKNAANFDSARENTGRTT